MTDALEAKIDGLAANMETRFSSHEKEQAGMVSWMERLSSSVDKLVELGGSMVAVQQRMSVIEGSQRDQALDIDGLDNRMSDIESTRKADKLGSEITKWTLGATGGAILAFFMNKLLGGEG